jgi:hypothetical protein
VTLKVSTPPGALSVDIDQHRYPVRDGHFVITSPEREPELREKFDALDSSFTSFRGAEGRVCCRRTAWPWETHCPKCGRAL